jgi:hypothetical protein
MIQADDPRLKTDEGWDELGAPEDATHWVGPCVRPWEKQEYSQRTVWSSRHQEWDDHTLTCPASDYYTVIPRPISAETISELTL